MSDSIEIDTSAADTLLVELAPTARAIQKAVAAFAEPAEKYRDIQSADNVFLGYEHLQVTSSDDKLTTRINHFNTVVEFETKIALDDQLNAVGVVTVSLVMRTGTGETKTDLGSFTVARDGRTNLAPRNARLEFWSLPQGTDFIVAHFLVLAHKRNLHRSSEG